MLKICNLTYTFPGAFRPTLMNMTLELRKGDFCVIIGSNGSGKSTLLKLISGEYSSDFGIIQVYGQESSRGRYRIVEVNQDVNKGTIGPMTLLENLAFSQLRQTRARLSFYVRHESKIKSILESLGFNLQEKMHQPMSSLSGGQRQLVATIMAIHSDPEILLLDEHTCALDPVMQKKVMQYTANSTAERGLTTVMVTHNLEDALNYGNRLIMLHNGKIVFDRSGQDKAKLSRSMLINQFLSLENHHDDE